MFSRTHSLRERLNRLASLDHVAFNGKGYFKSHGYYINNKVYHFNDNAQLPGYTFEKFDEVMRSGKKVKISQKFPNDATYDLEIGLKGGKLRLGWTTMTENASKTGFYPAPIAKKFLGGWFDAYKPFIITIKNDKKPGDEDEYYITTGKQADEIEWMDDLYKFLANFYILSSKLNPDMPAP
jgi:hypothetical protein